MEYDQNKTNPHNQQQGKAPPVEKKPEVSNIPQDSKAIPVGAEKNKAV